MKKDRIDILLQLAYLEGKMRTHGAYEKGVAKKKPSATVAPVARQALLNRLETALGGETLFAEIPMTVGGFLKGVRSGQSIRPQEIFSRIGLTQNIYRMLEQDRISPLKIPAESWIRFRRFFNLSTETLTEMIRRTHQLVFFRPSFRTTLARYDTRKRNGTKAATLEQAATELYTRAQLSIPSAEAAKLETLLASIAREA